MILNQRLKLKICSLSMICEANIAITNSKDRTNTLAINRILKTFDFQEIAIAISWKSKVLRILFIASVLVLSFEFVMAIFASQIIDNEQIFNLSRWFRIIPVGLASILAFFGMYHYFFYLE